MHTKIDPPGQTEDETRALLSSYTQDGYLTDDNTQSTSDTISIEVTGGFAPKLVLPIPFLAAVGVAGVAATTVFAYAVLLCKNPTECENDERTAYSTTVAAASLIGNVAALIMLGPMEKLIAKDKRMGLVLWLVFRSMSIVVLALGGKPVSYLSSHLL